MKLVMRTEVVKPGICRNQGYCFQNISPLRSQHADHHRTAEKTVQFDIVMKVHFTPNYSRPLKLIMISVG